MRQITLTADEQRQVDNLARRLTSLSPAELNAAHRAWKQAAQNITDYETARRLYLEHLALEAAAEANLEAVQAWHMFALKLAFGDVMAGIMT